MSLIINGEEIDEEIIEAEFRQIKGHYERTLQVSCCERDPEFLDRAKDNLISRALLQQEALKRVPEVTDEAITERLNRLIDQAGGQTQFYLNIGLTPKDEPAVRANVANGVRLDQTLAAVYAPEPDPTESEQRAWYENHISAFLTPEEVRAAHITKSLQGASSRDQVYALMRALRRELQTGRDFITLAEEHRSDEQQQIDLGFFSRGQFMEEFETIAFSMDIGEISPVFTTQLGFHICTVLDRRDPAPRPFDEVKADVRQRLIEAYRDDKFNAFLDELKAAATIEDTQPTDPNAIGIH